MSRRTLWDGGTLVQAVPALAGLHPEPRVAVNPTVLAELGLASGERVRLTSSRGSLVVAADANFDVPAGSAVLAWNVPGARAGELIDASRSFIEVRIDTAGEV